MNDRLIAAFCIVLANQLAKSDPNKPYEAQTPFNEGEFDRAVDVVRNYVGLAGPR